MTPRIDTLRSAVMDLERRRDELRLKLHLAKADARDEWERTEQKWERVRTDLQRAQQGTGKAVEEIAGGVQNLIDEISNSYKRIRSTISS